MAARLILSDDEEGEYKEPEEEITYYEQRQIREKLERENYDKWIIEECTKRAGIHAVLRVSNYPEDAAPFKASGEKLGTVDDGFERYQKLFQLDELCRTKYHGKGYRQVLGNLFPIPIFFKGKWFATVEHLIHSRKYLELYPQLSDVFTMTDGENRCEYKHPAKSRLGGKLKLVDRYNVGIWDWRRAGDIKKLGSRESIVFEGVEYKTDPDFLLDDTIDGDADGYIVTNMTDMLSKKFSNCNPQMSLCAAVLMATNHALLIEVTEHGDVVRTDLMAVRDMLARDEDGLSVLVPGYVPIG